MRHKPWRFHVRVSKYIKAGDYEKAIKFASSVTTPLAKVVWLFLQNRGKGRKNVGKAVTKFSYGSP